MADDDIDSDMLVVPQGITRGEQEYCREQVPLQLEPAIRAHIESIADSGIAGADEHRDQDQPINRVADPLVQA